MARPSARPERHGPGPGLRMRLDRKEQRIEELVRIRAYIDRRIAAVRREAERLRERIEGE